MADPDLLGVTRDTFFGGRLILEQREKGHRSGTDAVCLAAAVPRDFAGLVYDIGAGVGAVGLGVALMCPETNVTLIEKASESVALAERNIAANGMKARVEIVGCDALSANERKAKLPRKADLIVTNPPFYRADRVRASSDASRRSAHIMDEGADLDSWLRACIDLMSAKGTLVLVHHAEAIPELLRLLPRWLGALTLMAIHPRVGQPATRVLLRGKGGSRAPFRIAPPLILHSGNAFTLEAAALHAGTAAIDW